MAFKRATKAGQVIRIPLLSDPDYQARRLLRPEGLEVVVAEEKLFFESLDSSVLKTDLTDVTHVMIRGLNGKDYADIQVSSHVLAQGDYSETTYGSFYMLETIKRGLLSFEGYSVECPQPPQYPVEKLYGDGGLGQLWPLVMQELNARIGTWSALGESVGSPSAA